MVIILFVSLFHSSDNCIAIITMVMNRPETSIKSILLRKISLETEGVQVIFCDAYTPFWFQETHMALHVSFSMKIYMYYCMDFVNTLPYEWQMFCFTETILSQVEADNMMRVFEVNAVGPTLVAKVSAAQYFILLLLMTHAVWSDLNCCFFCSTFGNFLK